MFFLVYNDFIRSNKYKHCSWQFQGCSILMIYNKRKSGKFRVEEKKNDNHAGPKIKSEIKTSFTELYHTSFLHKIMTVDL